MNVLAPDAATTPPAAAAPFARAVLAQTRAELTLTLRRGESVLITVLVPAILLAFFASLRLAPGGADGITFLVPGILALAIISTGMVSLGIATAYERYYGVLKRLGSSPLPRSGLLLAKGSAVLALEAFQVALLLAIAAIFFGWRPAGSLVAALLVFIVGTACFAGLGMLMAGALRAEATLAGANALFLVFLILGGNVLPLDHLPAFLRPLAAVLPPALLSATLRGAMSPGGAVPWGSLALLAGWAVVIIAAAVRTFQWE
ncbi:MAG TPA: ABC transporter permease [Ktedonobacterales bacterium]|nr:ABC transporter permease [Ktedonobacterales bacterium]